VEKGAGGILNLCGVEVTEAFDEASIGVGTVVVEVLFAETKKKVIFLFGGNDGLSRDLFLDGSQKGGAEGGLTKLVDSDMDKV
jgi:hypothetical protein